MPQRLRRIGIATVVVAAVGAVLWIVLHRADSRRWEDDTPLPKGGLVEPEIREGDARSEVRVLVRTSLDALTRLANSLPDTHPVGGRFGSGRIRRGPVLLASAGEDNRLRLEGRATFDGTLGIGPLKISKVGCDLSGTTFALDVDRDWNWRMTPDVQGHVTDIDVPYVPDALAREVASLLLPYAPHVLGVPAVPLEPVAGAAWDTVQREVDAGGNAVGARLSLEPGSIAASSPLVDENSVHQTLVLRFSSRLDVGEAARGGGPGALRPLPRLERVPLAAPHSTLRIPVVVPVAELSRFWQPMTVDVPGGSVRIDRVEFSEQGGVLHGRMHFEFHAGRRLWPLVAESVRGFVRFETRIECGADAGRLAGGATLRISGFSFTQRSDSLLVDLCGAGAADLIRGGVEAAVPVLADACLLRINEVVRAEHEKYLSQAKQQLAARMTGVLAPLAPIVAAASPDIHGLSVRPTKLVVKGGHLLVVVEADASVGLTLR